MASDKCRRCRKQSYWILAMVGFLGILIFLTHPLGLILDIFLGAAFIGVSIGGIISTKNGSMIFDCGGLTHQDKT